VFDASHRSHVPNFGAYIKAEISGKMRFFSVSRQMVLFAVERRKAWRMLQSKAGVDNKDYRAQRELIKKVDSGKIEISSLLGRTRELFDAELEALK